MEEVWRPIPGYEDLYIISSQGIVKSQPRLVYYGDHRSYRFEPQKIKKQTLTGNKKYVRATLTNKYGITKHVAIHRLLAWAFIGPQDQGIEVRHINGDGLDNRVENIIYGTKSDNMRDAITHRTFSMSEWHPCAKLTNEQVRHIRESSEHYKDLARKFDIHPNTIHKIRRKEVRSHDEN
jgi:hypothetical protein